MQKTPTINWSLLPSGPLAKVAHAGRTWLPQDLPSVVFTWGLGTSTDLKFLCQEVPWDHRQARIVFFASGSQAQSHSEGKNSRPVIFFHLLSLENDPMTTECVSKIHSVPIKFTRETSSSSFKVSLGWNVECSKYRFLVPFQSLIIWSPPSPLMKNISFQHHLTEV